MAPRPARWRRGRARAGAAGRPKGRPCRQAPCRGSQPRRAARSARRRRPSRPQHWRRAGIWARARRGARRAARRARGRGAAAAGPRWARRRAARGDNEVTRCARWWRGGGDRVRYRLQPYVAEAATVCNGGCHLRGGRDAGERGEVVGARHRHAAHVEHVLVGRLEGLRVGAAQRAQRRLRRERAKVSAAEAMGTRGELAQQRRRQRPGGGVDAEDLLARRAVGQRKLELPVEAARPAQRRVERVDPVGGTDEDDLPTVRIRVRLGVRVGVGVGVGVRVRAWAWVRVGGPDEDDLPARVEAVHEGVITR